MGIFVLEGLVDVSGLAVCLFAGVYAVGIFRKALRKNVPDSFAECLNDSGQKTDEQRVSILGSEASISAELPDFDEQAGDERIDAFGGKLTHPGPVAGRASAGGWAEKKMRAVSLASGGLEEDEIASKLGVSPVAVGLMLHAGLDRRSNGGYGERLAVRA